MWLTRFITIPLIITLFKQINSCEISVDISDGTKVNNTYILHGGILFSKEHTFLNADNQLRGCICEYKTCIRKCCPENQYFHNNTLKCLPGNKEVNPTIHDGETIIKDRTHHFIVDPIPFKWCKGSKSILQPHLSEYDVFKLQKEGHLILTYDGIVVEALQFCADYLEDSKGFGVIECLPDTQESKISEHFHSSGKYILILSLKLGNHFYFAVFIALILTQFLLVLTHVPWR